MYSFQEWCIENSREGILNLWDYKLNIVLPSEVAFKSNLKYWFKCPDGKHDSELHQIQDFPDEKRKS